jgi:hypothetical protein
MTGSANRQRREWHHYLHTAGIAESPQSEGANMGPFLATTWHWLGIGLASDAGDEGPRRDRWELGRSKRVVEKRLSQGEQQGLHQMSI